MGWRAYGALGVACCIGACATGALTNGPDGGGGVDSSSGADVAPDNSGCPQYNLTNDPKHCGSCTHVCSSGQVCSNGACASQCTSPQVECVSDAGAICANTTNDPGHCGTCATECATADAGGMAPGTNNPDPGIFDGGYDGGIGWSLGAAACASSACGVDCPDAMALCTDEICYDLQNHHDHCGSCSTGCTATTEWCNDGHCCAVGAAWCTSACASLLVDNNNCGKCGNVCDGGSCNAGVCASCAPTTITGPSLTNNIVSWPNAGERIKALKNTVLTSFVVHNQGAADTISLTTTTGTVLQTLSLPASNTTYTASVSWALTAGTSYDLILANGSNGQWASYSSYPTSSVGLEVDDMVDTNQNLSTIYWFTFTNLTTCQ
jgi:hypothetical protein